MNPTLFSKVTTGDEHSLLQFMQNIFEPQEYFPSLHYSLEAAYKNFKLTKILQNHVMQPH